MDVLLTGYLQVEMELKLKGNILNRWQLYSRVGTEDTVLVTLILDQQDKRDVWKHLFDSGCREVKYLLVGDAIILTPTGFTVEHFISFHSKYKRI